MLGNTNIMRIVTNGAGTMHLISPSCVRGVRVVQSSCSPDGPPMSMLSIFYHFYDV